MRLQHGEAEEVEFRAYTLGWWRGLRVGLFICLGVVVILFIIGNR